MALEYPIGAVSKLTGIAVETLRAWERRYAAVTPAKSVRGRLYDESHVRRLQLLRSAVEGGRPISQVAGLSDEELIDIQLRAREFVKDAGPVVIGEAVSPEVQPLLEAVRGYDYPAANAELGRLAVLMRPRELVYHIILPLLRTLGDDWENGGMRMAQEHLFSACVRNLLGGLIRLHGFPGGTPELLFTTPPGELHEFGILSAALLAAAQPVAVTYLGPNLPASEIVNASNRTQPRAVVLGIMQINVNDSLRAEMGILASELPPSTELWLGGSGARAASEGLVRGGVRAFGDLLEFERYVNRLLTQRSSEPAR